MAQGEQAVCSKCKAEVQRRLSRAEEFSPLSHPRVRRSVGAGALWVMQRFWREATDQMVCQRCGGEMDADALVPALSIAAVKGIVEVGERAVAMTLDELNEKFGLEKLEVLREETASSGSDCDDLKQQVQRLFDETFQDRPDRHVCRHKPCRLIVQGVQSADGRHSWAAQSAYEKSRQAVGDQLCGGTTPPFPVLTDTSSVQGLTEHLAGALNEKLLFHGADAKYANAIMMTRVRVPEADQVVHGAIYGTGAHFAESATKADQYVQPALEGPHRGLYPIILNHVVLGSVKLLSVQAADERFPDELLKAKLRQDLSPQGSRFHSICGDRRNPPAGVKGGFNHYREFILYNENQSRPALLVWYSRDGESRDEAVARAQESVPEGIFEHHVRMDEGFGQRVAASRSTSAGRICVLGDISGSMSSGSRMPCLQKAFKQLVAQARQEQRPAVLGAWNAWINFQLVQPAGGQQGWRAAENWIEGLQPGGGNNMRYAIEQAMRSYPDVTDCYVMCDGDVSPFASPGHVKCCLSDVPRPSRPSEESSETAYAGTDWETFRARWQRKRFHFIAFGGGADADEMRKMANIGGGTLTVMSED